MAKKTKRSVVVTLINGKEDSYHKTPENKLNMYLFCDSNITFLKISYKEKDSTVSIDYPCSSILKIENYQHEDASQQAREV